MATDRDEPGDVEKFRQTMAHYYVTPGTRPAERVQRELAAGLDRKLQEAERELARAKAHIERLLAVLGEGERELMDENERLRAENKGDEP